MMNRVAGYAGFDSYYVTGVCASKPGQTKIERDYYKDANTVKNDGNTYLSTYTRFGSNHQNTVDKAVKPSDYKRVSRTGKQNLQYEFLHNPELYKYTKAGRLANQSMGTTMNPRASSELKRVAETNVAGRVAAIQRQDNATSNDKLYKTTKHWNTEYQAENNKTLSRPHSQSQRPFWSYPKREHVARRTFFKTEYQNTLGTYGHNPRQILNHESTKMENDVNELTMGSTKVTSHIPGYGGFLVKTDLNDKALVQTKSNLSRDLMKNKVNLNENFNVRIPGYAGYKPMSCLNDRGNVRPQLFSTAGETFF